MDISENAQKKVIVAIDANVNAVLSMLASVEMSMFDVFVVGDDCAEVYQRALPTVEAVDGNLSALAPLAATLAGRRIDHLLLAADVEVPTRRFRRSSTSVSEVVASSLKLQASAFDQLVAQMAPNSSVTFVVPDVVSGDGELIAWCRSSIATIQDREREVVDGIRVTALVPLPLDAAGRCWWEQVVLGDAGRVVFDDPSSMVAPAVFDTQPSDAVDAVFADETDGPTTDDGLYVTAPVELSADVMVVEPEMSAEFDLDVVETSPEENVEVEELVEAAAPVDEFAFEFPAPVAAPADDDFSFEFPTDADDTPTPSPAAAPTAPDAPFDQMLADARVEADLIRERAAVAAAESARHLLEATAKVVAQEEETLASLRAEIAGIREAASADLQREHEAAVAELENEREVMRTEVRAELEAMRATVFAEGELIHRQSAEMRARTEEECRAMTAATEAYVSELRAAVEVEVQAQRAASAAEAERVSQLLAQRLASLTQGLN